MPELDENHEHLSESGPYGSVRAHIQPESIPRGQGSLWDTSRALKPPGKIKIVGIRRLAEIPPIRPYFPGLGNRILSLLSAAGWPKADDTSCITLTSSVITRSCSRRRVVLKAPAALPLAASDPPSRAGYTSLSDVNTTSRIIGNVTRGAAPPRTPRSDRRRVKVHPEVVAEQG